MFLALGNAPIHNLVLFASTSSLNLAGPTRSQRPPAKSRLIKYPMNAGSRPDSCVTRSFGFSKSLRGATPSAIFITALMCEPPTKLVKASGHGQNIDGEHPRFLIANSQCTIQSVVGEPLRILIVQNVVGEHLRILIVISCGTALDVAGEHLRIPIAQNVAGEPLKTITA